MKKSHYLHEYPFKKVIAITRMLEFFQEIFKAGPFQFEEVIEHCKMFRLKSGETIIKKGELSSWIYFVLQGSCCVYLEKDHKDPVNQITPGSVFGELSVILNERRTAFVKAHPTQETTLVGVDASIFNYSDENNVTSKSVCTLFYRGLRHVVFKRNQTVINQLQEKGQNPRQKLELQEPPPFADTGKQLRFYSDECQRLGKLVNKLSLQLSGTMKLEALQKQVPNLMLIKLEEKKKMLDLVKQPSKPESREKKQLVVKKMSDLKFLIADKDEISCDIIREYLTNLGAIHMKEVSNGDQAWENLCYHPNYDVILCELDLAKLSGIQLLEKIASSGKRFNYPICVVLTQSSENMIKIAADAGAHGYVLKPFLKKELLKQLQHAFVFLKDVHLKENTSIA